MFLNNARNVNGALAGGLLFLEDETFTTKEESRNGPVTVLNGPLSTVTKRPMERVLFSPYRNANPFFHLMESLWMLAGRNDLPWVAQFNRQMAFYSDDGGKTQPAAYGHRWRNFFGLDQLELIVSELTERPNSRRAVLDMWDGGSYHDENPGGDLGRAYDGSKDVPCNTHCYFRIDGEGLHMMVCCRSNDAIWGAHGANAVHFSILLEYLAARLNVPMGTMTQVSFNYHLYDGVLRYSLHDVVEDCTANDRYSNNGMRATPIFQPDAMEYFDREVKVFCDYAVPVEGARACIPGVSGFLRTTALPMLQTWDLYKAGDLPAAVGATFDIEGSDWQVACREWLNRMYEKRKVQ